MYQRILFFLFLFCLLGVSAQAQNKLFDGFFHKMLKKNAISVLKENKKRFNNLKFGTNNYFVLRKGSLAFEDEILIHITLWSKNDLDSNATGKKLQEAVKYFESIGFKMVYSQPEWPDPKIKDLTKPYIRMVHMKEKLLVELEPRGQEDLFNVFLSYYDLEWFTNQLKDL
jgi:hypothetical protein